VSFDSIVAIATPSGKGGVGVLRLSGPESLKTASRFFSPKTAKPFPNNRRDALISGVGATPKAKKSSTKFY
jgi:tRNA U34 5-carboxymethylaminomethyl modifying GTPase MnmE/TrmE